MTKTDKAAVRFEGGLADVDPDAVALTIADIRARVSAVAERSGEHIWVISVVHTVPDPDVEPDTITLDESTFLALTPLACLTCGADYERAIRDGVCGGPASFEATEVVI